MSHTCGSIKCPRIWTCEHVHLCVRLIDFYRKIIVYSQEEKRERIEALTAQRDSLQSKLAAVEALRNGFEMPQLEGREVVHTQYGPGVIVQQKGAVITVKYGDEEKKQKLPAVVSGKFMSLQDEDLEMQFFHMDELDMQKDALQKKLQYANSLLSDLEKS